MKTLTLKSGAIVLLDDADWFILSVIHWYDAGRYPQRQWRESGVRKSQYMHRLIFDLHNVTVGDGYIDHVDGNGFNNQMVNLRACSHSNNLANSKLANDSTTGFKGVTASRQKFVARIRVLGEEKYLGIFERPEEAAKAYDIAAKNYFGEFARTNQQIGAL